MRDGREERIPERSPVSAQMSSLRLLCEPYTFQTLRQLAREMLQQSILRGYHSAPRKRWSHH